MEKITNDRIIRVATQTMRYISICFLFFSWHPLNKYLVVPKVFLFTFQMEESLGT